MERKYTFFQIRKCNSNLKLTLLLLNKAFSTYKEWMANICLAKITFHVKGHHVKHKTGKN